ncbi:ER membrane protein complex subunit 5-like [Saccoglossus kowalevskii]|uniref:Membrane magnesium transporter n=1 Tax=Saccoglossus kowalevskii TaxID=10224 RepID=A0ABM0GMD8_SACKO|nr:PREDICTED: membrane magnesium transporter 1-like [Saccoglossus kowalevskii]
MATSSHAFVIVGLLSLAHAAYSAAQHRAYLRLTEQEFTSLPSDIVLQCLISLLITIYGVVHLAGNFREIKAAAELENKSFDTASNRPSYYMFMHRGKVLNCQ